MALVNSYLANEEGGKLGLSQSELLNFPVVGDVVMSPHDFLMEFGRSFTLLKLDGSTFDPTLYPTLALLYPTNILPTQIAKIEDIPYRIVAK